MSEFEGKLRALVIDDDPFNQKFLETILTSEGYAVTCCSDGPGALAVSREACAAPDLIFVDIMMPEMDGVELIQHLREQASTSETAIICVSAGDNGDYFDAMEAGADEFLRKPYCRYDLLRAIALIHRGFGGAHGARGRYARRLSSDSAAPIKSIAG